MFVGGANYRVVLAGALAFLCAIFYLGFSLSINSTIFEQGENLVLQLGLATLLGLVIYVFTIAIYYFWTRYSKSWLTKVGPLELFKICNDVTQELQSEISQMISSASRSNESNQSLFIGRQAECFAYVYGLVLISMSNYDQLFMQSERFKQLNSRILQRLINIAKEKYSTMNVDMDLVEEQLRKTKIKELEKMLTGIEYYHYQKNEKLKNPLNKLVKHFGKTVSLGDKKHIAQLMIVSDRMLGRVDACIIEYKK